MYGTLAKLIHIPYTILGIIYDWLFNKHVVNTADDETLLKYSDYLNVSLAYRNLGIEISKKLRGK